MNWVHGIRRVGGRNDTSLSNGIDSKKSFVALHLDKAGMHHEERLLTVKMAHRHFR